MNNETLVQQDSYSAFHDGTGGQIRLNRRGELVVIPFALQAALDGRVFNISNEVQEGGATALIGETSPGTNNINPSILVDVPSGTTIIPLSVSLQAEGTGTTGDWGPVIICTDDGTHYSSGGNALTPVNARKDDPRTSNCSCYDGSTQIVASANTDDNIIWSGAYDKSAAEEKPLEYNAAIHGYEVLVGPACLKVFMTVNNVDEEVIFHVKWIEIPTTNIT